MGYAEFNPNVKKVNLKPKGEVEIILTTYLSDLRGSVETISDMIDQKVHISLESTVVTYNVQINSRTERPIKTYRVDDNGVVSEVKPEGEQMELNLGIPKRLDPIDEVPQEIDQKIVDDFILALLAPEYPDIPYPFYSWIVELKDGGTYMRIASDYGMSSGRVSDLLDEYRSRVAPLAAKWDEWMQGKVESEPVIEQEAEQVGKLDAAGDEPTEYEQEILNEMDKQEMEFGDSSGSVSDGEKNDSTGTGNEGDGKQVPRDSDSEPLTEISNEVVEEFILTKRPAFPEISLDFPTLLEQRRTQGKTWMIIATTVGLTSGQLNTQWKKYKDEVKKLMKGNGAA